MTRFNEAPAAHQDQERPCWVFMDPGKLPARWQDRAVTMMLVPLMPDEAQQLFNGEKVLPEIPAGDEELVKLLASGASSRTMARELGISLRTVHRRLAELRDRYEVRSTAQLAALLSRQGFTK
jgi:DNA-binding NarL/FixJ family response regulator